MKMIWRKKSKLEVERRDQRQGIELKGETGCWKQSKLGYGKGETDAKM